VVSYLDTSFLYKLYVNENASAEAVAWFRGYKGDIAISDLSDIEIASSLFRNFPRSQALQAHEIYAGDRMIGVYTRFAMGEEVFESAAIIAQKYAGQYKLRSLDILHLATALHYRVDSIATFDTRLADAAEALGLTVLPARS
jgi:predicted nucleic acid-binding protein